MDEEPTFRDHLMTVRELLARLEEKDPDFLVVLDPHSQSLIIVNPKPGFCSPAEAEEAERLRIQDQDRQFLRDLHIEE